MGCGASRRKNNVEEDNVFASPTKVPLAVEAVEVDDDKNSDNDGSDSPQLEQSAKDVGTKAVDVDTPPLSPVSPDPGRPVGAYQPASADGRARADDDSSISSEDKEGNGEVRPALIPFVMLTDSPEAPTFAKLSPDQTTIVAASNSPVVQAWLVHDVDFKDADSSSNSEVREIQLAEDHCYVGHENAVLAVDWSPNGKQLATTSADHFVRLWDTQSGECTGGVELEAPVTASCIRYSPKGKFFALGCSDSSIRVFRATDVEELLTLQGHAASVNCIEFSPNGQSIASASSDCKLLVWDVKTGEMNCEFSDHKGPIGTVKWSPDGQWLASGSKDHTVGIWGSEDTYFLRKHTAAVTGLSWVNDAVIWSASLDGTILCWDSVEQQVICTINTWGADKMAFGSVNHLAILNDTFLFCCTNNAGILIWRIGVSTEAKEKKKEKRPGAVRSPAAPSDGAIVALNVAVEPTTVTAALSVTSNDGAIVPDSTTMSRRYSRAGQRVTVSSNIEQMTSTEAQQAAASAADNDLPNKQVAVNTTMETVHCAAVVAATVDDTQRPKEASAHKEVAVNEPLVLASEPVGDAEENTSDSAVTRFDDIYGGGGAVDTHGISRMSTNPMQTASSSASNSKSSKSKKSSKQSKKKKADDVVTNSDTVPLHTQLEPQVAAAVSSASANMTDTTNVEVSGHSGVAETAVARVYVDISIPSVQDITNQAAREDSFRGFNSGCDISDNIDLTGAEIAYSEQRADSDILITATSASSVDPTERATNTQGNTKEIASLQSQLIDKGDEIEELQRTIAQLSNDQDLLMSELNFKSATISEQQEQIESLEIQVSELQVEAEHSSGELGGDKAHLLQQIDELQLELSKTREDVTAARALQQTISLAASSASVALVDVDTQQAQSLQQELNRLHAIRDIDKIESAASIEQYELQIQTLTDELAETSTALSKSEETLSRLTTEFQRLSEVHQDLKGQQEVKSAGNDAESLQSMLTGLQEQNVDLQSELKRLQDELDVVTESEKGKRTQQQQQMLAKDRIIRDLTGQLSAMRNERGGQQKQQVDSLTEEVAILQSKVVEAQTALSMKEQEMRQLSSANSQTATHNDELRAAVRRLTADKTTLGGTAKALQKKCDQSTEIYQLLTSERDKLAKDVRDITEEVTVLSEDNIKLSDELQECKIQLQQKSIRQADFDSLSGENEIVRSQLQQAESTISQLRQEMQSLFESRSRLEQDRDRLAEHVQEKSNVTGTLAEENLRVTNELKNLQLKRQQEQQLVSANEVFIFQNSVLQREREELKQRVCSQDLEIEELRRLADGLRDELQKRDNTAAQIQLPRRSAPTAASAGTVVPRVLKLDISEFGDDDDIKQRLDQSSRITSPPSSSSPTKRSAASVSPHLRSPSSVDPSQSDHPSVAAMRYQTISAGRMAREDSRPMSLQELSAGSRYQGPKPQQSPSNGTPAPSKGEHSDWIRCVSWSPDGSHIATGSHSKLVCVWPSSALMPSQSTASDASATLRQIDKRVVKLQGHEGWVMSVAWSNDGKRLASASFDCCVIIWQPRSGQLLHQLRTCCACHAVCWSHDNVYLAAGTTDKHSYVWESESGALVSCLRGHSEPVVAMAWSPTERRIATGAWDSLVHVYSPPSRSGSRQRGGRDGHQTAPLQDSPSLVLSGHEGFVLSVSWSRDGQLLASSSSDCTIRIWVSATGQCAHCLLGHQEQVTTIAFRNVLGKSRETNDHSDDAESMYVLASASADNTIRYWSVDRGEQIDVIEKAHSACITSLSWNSSGNNIASVSVDKLLKLW
jgi:WD40 repeat protein/DNA repair exonuclease SbcCD ATPase subunit